MKFPAALSERLTRAVSRRLPRPGTGQSAPPSPKTLPKPLAPLISRRARRKSAAGQSKRLAEALLAQDRLDDELLQRLDRQLILPCADETNEETSRAAVQDYGQFLARQERWDDLATLIRQVDSERRATDCAMSHAELLCYGARADVVHAVEDALADGVRNPGLDGIEALEEVLLETPTDYALAALVALAHTDIGWAWRGGKWPHEIPERNLKLFEAHFDRAAEILAPFHSAATGSPLIAAARCTLLAARPLPAQKLADEYEALIALDPLNPRPMRALGHHLLPRWHGSYDQLELEARRTASHTSETWGNGGYTWVFFDALKVDPGAARIVDLDFFLDGMRDILALHPTQHRANLLAAYAAITMAPARTPENAPDLLREVRAAIHATLDWVLSDYLCELHPLLWAQEMIEPASPAFLPVRKTLIRRGRVAARHTIARHFADEILGGTTIAFSPHGLRFYQPGAS